MGKNPKVTRFDNRNIVFLDKGLSRSSKEKYFFVILGQVMVRSWSGYGQVALCMSKVKVP